MGAIKKLARTVGLASGAAIALPLGAAAWLEKHALKKSDKIFHFGAHAVALVPGIAGNFVRTAYYMMTLDACHPTAVVSFGSYFSSRHARIAEHSGTGAYCVVGMADIGSRVRVASRVSIVSGLHEHGSADDIGNRQQSTGAASPIVIGGDTWIGEGAVVGADVGEGSIVGLGSVVLNPLPANSLALGNPARRLPTKNAKNQ
ncbi:MAG: hypothetical protein QNJ97_12195 [Myxococcota bacterium]|nr:hypothetical protein [Myxococcota bacterium]